MNLAKNSMVGVCQSRDIFATAELKTGLEKRTKTYTDKQQHLSQANFRIRFCHIPWNVKPVGVKVVLLFWSAPTIYSLIVDNTDCCHRNVRKIPSSLPN
jgi:hypothetical protein